MVEVNKNTDKPTNAESKKCRNCPRIIYLHFTPNNPFPFASSVDIICLLIKLIALNKHFYQIATGNVFINGRHQVILLTQPI